ncbi:hypothetical protein [Nafulsella turpanensis]|uniref:hypothetical protein n=1 Tax=Nafulsella turpanensis TaxID=1265690 RepID=UPI00034CF1DB|nr:hypothetical protein [Nafulsella turpanensis]
MELLSVKNHVIELIKAGHYWQTIDINGKEKKFKFFFSSVQLILVAVSIILVLILGNYGLDSNSVGYIMGIYAIFIGVFLTLALTVFGKFGSTDFESPLNSLKEKAALIQKKNFFKQFTSLILYAILISLLNIFLLLIGAVFGFIDLDVSKYSFITNLEDINKETFFNGVIFSLVSIYRITTFYFMFDFFLLTLYSITSIHSYFNIEYDKIKINRK